MEYIKINDELQYIYDQLQKCALPFPIACLPRDKAKEEEFYEVKEKFASDRFLINLGWRYAGTIAMSNSKRGQYYKIYHFTNNEKNALVSAVRQHGWGYKYEKPEEPVFFCERNLISPYILFTDSLILADNLAKSLFGETLMAVTSFLGREDLDKLDFSIFSGKTIIYCLVEHSGYDWHRTCYNAMDLIKHFPENTTIYFLSYPERNINYNRSIYWPAFLSNKKQFEEEYDNLDKELPTIPPEVNFGTPLIPHHQEIAEGVFTQTLSWLYDGGAKTRTEFLTHWSASVTQGLTNIQAHKEFPAKEIAYIYINCEDDGFTDGLYSAFEGITKRKLSKPKIPDIHGPVPDEVRLLLRKEIILKYPGTDEPFSKIKPNFYYTLVFPIRTLGNTESGNALNLINTTINCLSYVNPKITVLVLDIPCLWSFGIPMASFAEFLYSIRRQYAVILSTNAPHKNRKSLIDNLPFDKIVRLQRTTSSPEDTSINLIVERDDIKRKGHTISLIRGSKEKQWRTRTVNKLSVKEKMMFIKKNHDKRIREIAIELGISESYVKKLRRKAEVSKKVPSRAPKYAQRKLINQYSS